MYTYDTVFGMGKRGTEDYFVTKLNHDLFFEVSNFRAHSLLFLATKEGEDFFCRSNISEQLFAALYHSLIFFMSY